MLNLEEKTVFITGATSGIGKEIAKLFTKQGASIAFFGTSGEKGEQTLKELEEIKIKKDQKFLFEILDVSNFDSVDKIFTDIILKFEKIDVLMSRVPADQNHFSSSQDLILAMD